METVIRIIISIIGTGIGYLFLKYANQIYSIFGSFDFAEKYLRFFGGTRLIIKLFGIFVIFLSFLYATNLTGTFLSFIVSPFVR